MIQHLHDKIYRDRFGAREDKIREATWDVVCRNFLGKYISPQMCVLDIGAGDGYFLRYITARRRIAVDVGAQVLELTQYGIEVVQHHVPGFKSQITEPADLIFISNFLEHLPDKRAVIETLAESYDVLKPGGSIIILQPNLRYVGVRYWDYIDHCVALTEESLAEALSVSGFELHLIIPRFLPFTVKSGVGRMIPVSACRLLVSWYLKIPLLWRIFGGQALVVAGKPAATATFEAH